MVILKTHLLWYESACQQVGPRAAAAAGGGAARAGVAGEREEKIEKNEESPAFELRARAGSRAREGEGEGSGGGTDARAVG